MRYKTAKLQYQKKHLDKSNYFFSLKKQTINFKLLPR